MTNEVQSLPIHWQLSTDQTTLSRRFEFKSYLKTIGFVNAVAWEANKMNHHPDLQVSYNHCTVNITTHDAGRLTEKDFQLAEKINYLSS